MPTNLNPHSWRVRVLLLLAAGVLLAGLGYAVVHQEPVSSNPEVSGPIQLVQFTVYNEGLFPKEVRAGEGEISLHMNDMSSGSEGLIVVGESGKPVSELVLRSGLRRDKVRIPLTAGNYTVYDASRPDNRAMLIIEAQ